MRGNKTRSASRTGRSSERYRAAAGNRERRTKPAEPLQRSAAKAAVPAPTEAPLVASNLTARPAVEPLLDAHPPLVSEEETIESSKYVARTARRFEEDRFLFPESYGVNKVRLLIKDPQWLFAHWDVDPASFDELRQSLGERMVALARLTLRVHDAVSGGASVVLLPAGARSWYVRADTTRRSYRAELGVTLPSGEFRLLAHSNTVMVPRQAPSSEIASATYVYRPGEALTPTPSSADPGTPAEPEHTGLADTPWQPAAAAIEPRPGAGAPPAALLPSDGPDAPSAPVTAPAAAQWGGASDTFAPPGGSAARR